MENYLFANEAKPLRGIFLHSDCEELQADIHTLQESSDKWLLCFHIEKCKAMIENRKILNGQEGLHFKRCMVYLQWNTLNLRKILG